jgi:choline dehydrogenase
VDDWDCRVKLTSGSRHGLEYGLFRTGPVASNIVEGGAFWWVDRDEPTPDTQLHFLVGADVEEGIAPVRSRSGCTMNAYACGPCSRGTVRLQDPDPRTPPLIDPNYPDDPRDLPISVGAVKLNTNAATIMIGERPAELVRGNAATAR